MPANLGGSSLRTTNREQHRRTTRPWLRSVPRGIGILLAAAAVTAAAIASAVAPSGRIAIAAPSDETAEVVFGQAGSFATSLCNQGGAPTASTLCVPTGMAFDSAGNLFVADDFNNRVLEYNTPLTTDLVADRVFGQLGSFVTSPANNGGISADSLFNPLGIALDASDNLYVADSGNNRVLEYDAPIATDTTADRVFGQTLFTTNLANMGSTATASSLFTPRAVNLDTAGRLYVSDVANNRLLVYNGPLSDATADYVLGQAGSFTTGSCNMGGSPTASTLCSPGGAVIDAFDHLYLADSSNNRVLEYDSPLTTDTVADRVLGQLGSFTSNTCNNGGISDGSLCFPAGLTRDRAGDLFVADYTNNRTLVYADPLYLDTRADRVFGQGGSFSSNTCNNGGVSATSQCLPVGVLLDTAQNLFVSDLNNHRVLEYDAPVDFIVNSSNDVDDTVCDATHCSLREAINAANTAPGFNAIEFSIGSGLVTIAPASGLPAISGVVNLDGASQPGYAGLGPIVEIRGDLAGGGVDGITVSAGSSLLRGLVVNRFTGNGIKLTAAGGNTVVTSGAGRDLTLAVQPNGGDGVFIDNSYNFIGIGTIDRDANVFSGNTGNGVRISGAIATGNVITNNAIGTNGNLTNIDQGNTLDGVRIDGAPTNTVFYNVLSGNESDGIEINGAAATGNIVRGNAIGTDRYGGLDLGNTLDGVRITNATGNSIGLSAVFGYGNLISGNGLNGIRLDGNTNTVKGNRIGTDLAGTAAIANGGHGIEIPGNTGNHIGGTTAADRNVISGNLSDGVNLSGLLAGGNTIDGNYIGVNALGTATLGNGASGVNLTVIAFALNGSNLIGGTVPGAGNVISGNGIYGVFQSVVDGTIVQGNYIGLLPDGAPGGNLSDGVIIGSEPPATPSAGQARERGTSSPAMPDAASRWRRRRRTRIRFRVTTSAPTCPG